MKDGRIGKGESREGVLNLQEWTGMDGLLSLGQRTPVVHLVLKGLWTLSGIQHRAQPIARGHCGMNE